MYITFPSFATYKANSYQQIFYTLSENHRITKSQNCRGLKGPPEVIKNNPPTKAGSLVAQVGVQASLESLQRRRLHNLSRQPVVVLHHPYCIEILPCLSTSYIQALGHYSFSYCSAPSRRAWLPTFASP